MKCPTCVGGEFQGDGAGYCYNCGEAFYKHVLRQTPEYVSTETAYGKTVAYDFTIRVF